MKHYKYFVSILFSLILVISVGSNVRAAENSSMQPQGRGFVTPEGNLQNDMTPSEDYPADMTVDQYLEQYTYPHLPKGGVTSAYKSTEVDIRSVDKNKIALVRNTNELNDAIANNNIEVISFMASFRVTSLSSNGAANRKIVFEGNNMLVDFGTNLSNLDGANREIVIQNLNSYHGNYYGFFRPTANTSILKFHNLNDYGSQIISSQNLPVQISGDFQNRFTNNGPNSAANLVYRSPIDGTTNVTAQTVDQQNFESSNLEFFADSNVTLQTGNGINIDLTSSGNIVFYENAKVNIIGASSSNGSGEGYQGYAISTRNTSNFIMNKNSEINYTYTDPGNGNRNYAGLLWFQSAGSTFNMSDGAKLTVNKNSHTGNNGLIHFNASGSFNMKNNSSIEMNVQDVSNGATAVSLAASGSTFNVDEGSSLKTNFTSSGSGNNPVINLGGGASFNIGNNSTVDLTTKGYNNNILSLGSGNANQGTQFNVGENATFNINSTNRNSWSADVMNVGNYANFKVNRLGTFVLSADQARYLFNVGTNSVFQFSDAKLVEFGFTNSPPANSALINMNGNFSIDVQRVKAWNRSSSVLNSQNPDYDWNPMFAMSIPYQGVNINRSSLSGSSTTPGTAENFKANFNTGTNTGFQKLRFDFIPDVDVMIDNKPTDNPASTDSKKIIGTATAGAYVRLTDTVVEGGYSSFPKSNNNIPNPSINLDGSSGETYTVIADETGHFEFTVPTETDVPFVAGNTIQAYAFKDGKSATTEAVVSDTTPPEAELKDLYFMKGSPVPDVNEFVVKLTDTNPSGSPSVEYITPTETLSEYMNTVGVHEIEIKAQDNAGNSKNYVTKLHILESTSGINGDDVTLTSTDIMDLTNDEFQTLIKNRVNASAYVITDGKYNDLTDKIQFDFSSVVKKAGEYDLKISVSSTDSGVAGGLNKTVKITIGNLGPTNPVDPDNPQEGTTPPNGSENGGTNQVGALRMDYAPSNISFGTVKYNPGTTIYSAKDNKNMSGADLSKQWIQVSDDRTEENGWSVKVSQEHEFTDGTNQLKGATITIPKGEIRNSLVEGVIPTTGSDAKMTSSTVEISAGMSSTMFSAKNLDRDSLGKQITTYQWDPTKVTLKVPKGTAKVNSSYSTTINWSLVSSPDQ